MIDFCIKSVMTDDVKVAEHKLVGALMAAKKKMVSKVNYSTKVQFINLCMHVSGYSLHNAL